MSGSPVQHLLCPLLGSVPYALASHVLRVCHVSLMWHRLVFCVQLKRVTKLLTRCGCIGCNAAVALHGRCHSGLQGIAGQGGSTGLHDEIGNVMVSRCYTSSSAEVASLEVVWEGFLSRRCCMTALGYNVVCACCSIACTPYVQQKQGNRVGCSQQFSCVWQDCKLCTTAAQ